MLANSDDAQKLRQLETEKKLRRWRLCRWPQYDVSSLIPSAAPGAGKWETLSMDLDTLKRLKGTLDKHVVRRSPQAEKEASDEDGGAEDGQEDEAPVGAKCADLDAEDAGKERGESHEGDENEGAVVAASHNGQLHSQNGAGTAAAGSGVADMERGKEMDAALVAVADLAGRVLANIAAERERKKKAEELRKLAEAEVGLLRVPRLTIGRGGGVSRCRCACACLSSYGSQHACD